MLKTTRRASLGAFVWVGLGGLAWLAGCGGMLNQKGEGRKLKKDAKVISWNFAVSDRKMKLQVLQGWKGFLDLMDKGGFALLEDMKAKGYQLRANVDMQKIGEDPRNGAAKYNVKIEYFFPKKDAKQYDPNDQSVEAKVARARAGAWAPPAEVDKATFQAGIGGLTAVAGPIMQVNMLSDATSRVVFGFRVSKERIKAGKDDDFMGDGRPQDETFADIDMTLALNAQSFAEYQLWRARLTATLALLCTFDAPTGLDELKAELKEQSAMIDEWVAANPEPTKEKFGVGMEELPSPDGLFKWLDEHMGMATAIVEVGMGVASGSPQATLEGLAKLAPEDSSIKTVLVGLTAASKGDIQGVIEATASLTGYAEEVKSVKEKVASVKDRLGRVKNAMGAAGFKPPV